MLDLLIQNAALPDGRVGTSVAVRGGKIVEATNAAKVMHLKGYGLEVGCDASFVLLQARDPIEAIRLRANRLKMWRKGKLLAETAAVVAKLQVEGRSNAVSFSHS